MTEIAPSLAAAPARLSLRALPGPGTLLAGLVVLLGLLAMAAPGLLTSRGPLDTRIVAAMQPPGLDHWFGTDELGRDVYSRVVHGARYSLSIGIGSTLIAGLAGMILGLAASLAPRGVDNLLMRLTDFALAFPTLLFALVTVALLGAGPLNVMWAIAFATVPLYTKLTRSQLLLVQRSEFIEALRLLGLPFWRLQLGHVLPNAMAPLLVVLTTGVGNAIIIGAGLSFLGMGARPPEPEWGLMLAGSRNHIAHAWWLVAFPGLAITVTVISFTVLGRAIRQRRGGDMG